MKICIIATSENVEAIRATAYEKLPQLVGHQLLNFPASPTGELPATHWLCQLEATQELYDTLLSIKNNSVMETKSMKAYLESQDLKLVRSK
jgi:hypothetical protein